MAMKQERRPEDVAARPGGTRPTWAEQVRRARESVLTGRAERAERRRAQSSREAQQGKPSWLEE